MRTLPDENKLSDSIIDGREREKRFRAESEKRQAEQNEQEQRQRDRQARHEAEARKIDEEVRARLFMRVMQTQEAKPQADVPPVPIYTERQDTELAAEQAQGRRMLEKYAQRNRDAAAVRERGRGEEEAKEIPGFQIDP
jgi:hypothetical protein